MRQKRVEHILAGLVGLSALGLYVSTVAPTVSFWDPGERIASAYHLQVMHAPGAPFYLLLGRLFSMLAPSQETVALAVNLLSVLASAGTVMLTHLIIVRLVRRSQKPSGGQSPDRDVVALASGVLGAFTFSVTDSFWFNAGIAEVYALSTFFTALVVWLALRWSSAFRTEREWLGARQVPRSGFSANRYLILIAFLFGIAIGVHLLSLLAFFFVALIVFFTAFEQHEWTSRQRWGGLVLTGVVGGGLFLVIYPGVVQGIPKAFRATGAPFLTALALAAGVGYGAYATHIRNMPAANLGLTCLAVILIGYSSYALVPLRSATEPPIDINDPDTIERLIGYLEREQYGDTPLLQGATYDDEAGRVNPRGGQTTLFPRRHSLQPKHWEVYRRYDSDLEYFLDYQVGHMYARYFLWNFVGRASDVQGAPSVTGIPFLDPDSTSDSTSSSLTTTPNGTVAEPPPDTRNVYFALPLLLGLFGAFYHFRRDWRRALSVLALFFMTGIGIVIYLNQTPMQPRERDYSYVGSFLAFSLWTGIGAGGLIRLALRRGRDWFSGKGRLLLGAATGLFLFFAVPGWMAVQNYGDHDRSESYVPRDYAYNLLTGLEENAILFTNGDNDTYPLWYLQAVEGVRRDVRVVNLSLLRTKWYIRQLKDQSSFQSDPLPISLSDQRIGSLRPDPSWNPRTVQLPVGEESSRWKPYLPERTNSASVETPMRWTLEGRKGAKSRRTFRVADFAAYNILLTNAENGWKRPVYFATTVSPESRLNLGAYLQHEGQAYRVLPIKHDQPGGRVVPGLTDTRMSTFRFTGLADSSAHHSRTARRMADSYRRRFGHVARRLAEKGAPEAAEKLLEGFSESMPLSSIPGGPSTLLPMARAHRSVGNEDRAAGLMSKVEDVTLRLLSEAETQEDAQYALYLARRVQNVYSSTGAKKQLASFRQRFKNVYRKQSSFPIEGKASPG